jgi:hypothetical protein
LSGFAPVDEFSRTDADVTFWTLQNQVEYTEPVQDPWFKSTTPRILGDTQVFQSDYVSSALGCIEQYQFCNRTTCTDLNNTEGVNMESVSIMNYNAAQKATFDALWKICTITRVNDLTYMLQDSLLLAKDRLFGESRISTPVPDDQWQHEVRNVFNVTLTLFQSLLQYHANAPNVQITPNTTYHEYVFQENSTEALQICKNQKIMTAGYYSISVFGLVIVLATVFAIILASNTVPTLVTMWRSRGTGMQELDRIREAGWEMDDVLYIDSIALDAHGVGPWCDKLDVPVPVDEYHEFVVPWIQAEAIADDDASSLLFSKRKLVWP